MRVGGMTAVMRMMGVRKPQLLVMSVGRRGRRRLMSSGMVRMNGRHARVMQPRWHPGKALSQRPVLMRMMVMGRPRRGSGPEQRLRIEWTRQMIGKNRRILRITGR